MINEPNSQYQHALDNEQNITTKFRESMPLSDALALLNAQATLALVMEQRTANLISVLQLRPDIVRAEERAKLATHVNERLGL